MNDLKHWIRKILTSQKAAFKAFRDLEKEKERRREFLNSINAEEFRLAEELQVAKNLLLKSFSQEDFDKAIELQKHLSAFKAVSGEFGQTAQFAMRGISEEEISVLRICMEKALNFLKAEFEKVRAEEDALHRSRGLEGESSLTSVSSHLSGLIASAQTLLDSYSESNESQVFGLDEQIVQKNSENEMFVKGWVQNSRQLLLEILPA
jgi:hypothetical protein